MTKRSSDQPNEEGVHEARTDRNANPRDALVKSGIAHLKDVPFDELDPSVLEQQSGLSAGSFSEHFGDKQAFFKAMQAAALAGDLAIIQSRLDPERLAGLSTSETLDELVDTMADIFSSEARGILRESLLRIQAPEDAWAPMRQMGMVIQRRIVDRLHSSFPAMTAVETERKLRFCYQIIAGVLQNDLLNDYHVVSSSDQSIRVALKVVVADHMGCDSRY